MRLSRGRCTYHMRTSSSFIEDSGRASLVGVEGESDPSRPSTRSAFAASIGARAGVEPQVVDIWVNRGYQPAQTVATADAPLRLVFHRHDADLCTERVVFSSPRIERRLVANGTTVVDLPGQPPGIVRFTCGMGRYRGEIALVKRRATRVPRGWLLRSLAASAAAIALLAGIGMLQVEAAAGVGVLIAGATAVVWVESRFAKTRPSSQS